ncbi:histidine kinase [Nesterenkonia rhizosphaerae]|uniref:histidine kinase n=2 Tax=Nesterenkonia rhizosphaerae TaxID=1348272 RepID=A0ABP9FS65_9MICC
MTVLLLSVAALGGYTAMGYPSIGVGLPLAAALFSAAERDRHPWPISLAAALVFTLFFSVLAASFVHEADTNVFSMFVHSWAADIALMAAVIALGDSIRARRDLAQRSARLVEATAEHERSLAQRVAAEERTAIARELHDTLGHQNTVISMHAEVATAALPGEPKIAQSSLAVITSTSRGMMKQLRDTVHTLREHEIRQPSLDIKTLEKTVLAGSPLELDTDIRTGADLDHDVEATAYRIVQEALTNVAKHSHATRAFVQIRDEDNQVSIVVHDEGPLRHRPGTDSSRVGILGMKERAAALGGWLTAERQGDGFEVRAALPTHRSPQHRPTGERA